VRRGRFRRYHATEVLAHWATVKPAYRVTLTDGTQLVASADHRFLTERGWKYVTGRDSGGGIRPRLLRGNKLVGTGRFAPPPVDSADYRRGYLCGVIRADSHAAAPAGGQALERVRAYLDGFQVADPDAPLRNLGHSRRALTAVRLSSTLELGTVADLVHWPAEPTDGWRKGFLAGVFDAEGSYGHSVLRIAHTDHEIIKQSADCLRSLGFDVVTDAPAGAVTGKRRVDGAAIMARARLTVESVQPLGLDLPLFDITTGTGDFIADGVVSHNCFARNTHTYLDLDAGLDFDTRVVVKVNAGDLLRRELAAPRWRGAPIAMGTNVDCYQRAEGRYRLMPEIIAALRDFANPFSILTKGTLILRDMGLLEQAARVTSVGLSMSIGFVDEAVWRSVEPGTPSPRRRLDAVRRLTDAGFAVGVLMAPILPGITDTTESIDETVHAIAAAGAASVTPLALHLRTGAREWYMAWLARERPDLLPLYRALYGDGAYLGSGYQREVAARVRIAARRHGLDPRPGSAGRPALTRPEQVRAGTATSGAAEPTGQVPEQLTLL
jgi:DNA repair photolyase